MLTHLKWIVVGIAIASAGLVGGFVLYNRYTTGNWRMPTGNDLVRIKKNIRAVTNKAPKTVYLHRGPITLSGGDDDATRNISSIVGHTGQKKVSLRGFRGSDQQWARIVSCVRATFRPFDIDFVDTRPTSGDYMMAVVGGKPDSIGYQTRHVGGLAPFNGDLIHNAVVFAFSDALHNRKRAVCNTIAMEVAHAYGLDHSYECSDVMTYLPDCGPKMFRDKDVPCGEHKPRACPKGRKTQNSFQRLRELVGVRASPK